MGKNRQVIVLFSDDAAHELGTGKNAKNYPRGMADNFEMLTKWWGNEDEPGFMGGKYHKRLKL